MQQLEYWQIEIWDAIPQQWRDVLFHHEFTELQELSRGRTYPLTHQIATEETDRYLTKFFSADERAAFAAEMDALRKQR